MSCDPVVYHAAIISNNTDSTLVFELKSDFLEYTDYFYDTLYTDSVNFITGFKVEPRGSYTLYEYHVYGNVGDEETCLRPMHEFSLDSSTFKLGKDINNESNWVKAESINKVIGPQKGGAVECLFEIANEDIQAL